MPPTADKSATDPFAAARRRMVDEQIRQRENYAEGVLTAMRTAPSSADALTYTPPISSRV